MADEPENVEALVNTYRFLAHQVAQLSIHIMTLAKEAQSGTPSNLQALTDEIHAFASTQGHLCDLALEMDTPARDFVVMGTGWWPFKDMPISWRHGRDGDSEN